MTRRALGAIDRRMAIGGVLAGAAGLALPHRQSRTVFQRGMVGGGLARFEQGAANFSLFASRLSFAEEEPEVVVGSVIWVDDPTGLTLRSTVVTDYIAPEVQPEQGHSRHIVGMMSADGEGEFPFALEVIDVDLPGCGLDPVKLTVGDDARVGDNATPSGDYGFRYMATGTVVTGDILEIHIGIDPATEDSQPAKV